MVHIQTSVSFTRYSVATNLSYGGKIFILVMSHFFLIPTLKEFKKSTNICQSYSKNKSGTVFLTHSVEPNLCRLWQTFFIAHRMRIYLECDQCENWPKRTGGEGQMLKCLNFCTGIEILSRFSLKNERLIDTNWGGGGSTQPPKILTLSAILLCSSSSRYLSWPE